LRGGGATSREKKERIPNLKTEREKKLKVMKTLATNTLKYPLRENTKIPLILTVLIPTLIV